MRKRGSAGRAALAAMIAALSLVATPAPGTAAPPNPSDDEIESGRDEVTRAAERVGVLANRVAAAGAELTAAQLELAVTYDEVTAARQEQRVARAEADAAQAGAAAARAEADAARARIRSAQQQVDEFVAASFRQGSVVGSITAFLGSDSPEDLLDRAALLDSVSGSQLDALDVMRRAQIEKANLDSAARAALQEARARQQAAADAKAAADAAYAAAVAAEAAAQRRNAELLAREADLERRLAEARRALNRLEAQRHRFEDWQAAQAAQASRPPPSAPATTSGEGLRPGGVVAPTSGTITSTYGPRWGSIHYGLDIANEIGTPIVSVMDGRVISSGPASGFGLWVRVRHDDGTITVYGHIDEALVSVGERVAAGEQIATVGNRGESTGPHLHFEVHMNGRKVDPLVWLRSNGVSI
jgi:murein DD-endopeptidase MepM/ murein hydrolase activator NlpD